MYSRSGAGRNDIPTLYPDLEHLRWLIGHIKHCAGVSNYKKQSPAPAKEIHKECEENFTGKDSVTELGESFSGSVISDDGIVETFRENDQVLDLNMSSPEARGFSEPEQEEESGQDKVPGVESKTDDAPDASQSAKKINIAVKKKERAP